VSTHTPPLVRLRGAKLSAAHDECLTAREPSLGLKQAGVAAPKPRCILMGVVAIAVALVLQVAWLTTRGILEHAGFDPSDGHLITMSAACLVASYVAIAVAAGGLACRLHGTQRVGAWIAVGASLAFVAAVGVYDGLLRASAVYRHTNEWAITLRERGWSIADALVILGFAIAAGRRGAWLAPPAIGLALLGAQLGESRASWSLCVLLVMLVAKSALIVLLAARVESSADPQENDSELALAALRRLELCSWIWVVSTLAYGLAHYATPSAYVAVASAALNIVVYAIFASAAWSSARASIRGYPRWLWSMSATLCAFASIRILRTWALTVSHHWGDVGATHLTTASAWVLVPGVLSGLCSLAALAVHAHRSASRETARAAVVAAVFSAIAFSTNIALATQPAAHIASVMMSNLSAALAYRIARSAIRGDVPRARIV